jgi:SlyX protein
VDEDRLIEIETRFAYQEKTVKELNEVIISQQKSIDKLEAGLAKLSERFGQLSQVLSGIDAPADEKPPHY